MRIHFINKLTSIILVFSFVLPTVAGVALAYPREAKAAVPITVVIDPIQAAGNVLADFGNAILGSLELKEYILDALMWAFVKFIIHEISTSLITWINSGFRGDPLYIGNLEFFFYDVCAETLDSFMGDFMAQPIPNFAKSVIARGVAQTNPCAAVLGESADFILPTLAESIVNILYNDLQRATWQTLTQFLNSRNNFYGQQRMAEYELARREMIKANVRDEQLDFGSGFLQFEQCTQIDDPSYSAVMGTSFEYCQNLTPGAIVEDHLAEVLGDDVRTLEIADEIDEIIAALVQQLISQAFGGVMGLFGVGAPGGYNPPRPVSPLRPTNPGVTGGSGTRPPTPMGDLILLAAPEIVPPGGTSTISWSADALLCRVSGGWSGPRGSFGSERVGPLSASQTYSMSCTMNDGSLQTLSILVTVR